MACMNDKFKGFAHGFLTTSVTIEFFNLFFTYRMLQIKIKDKYREWRRRDTYMIKKKAKIQNIEDVNLEMLKTGEDDTSKTKFQRISNNDRVSTNEKSFKDKDRAATTLYRQHIKK